MKKIRISELPLVGSLKGLFSIGVDKDNRSVKFSLQTVEDLTEEALSKAEAAVAAAEEAKKAASNPSGYTETDPTVPDWAKASSKPSYTAEEIGALPSSTKVPTKTSDLTNDSGFLTGHQSLSDYYTKEEVDNKIAAGGTSDPAALTYDASWVLGLVKTGGTVTEERFAAISAAVAAGSRIKLADSGVVYHATASWEEGVSASLNAVVNLLCPAYNTCVTLYRIAKDRTIYVAKFFLSLDTELNATSRNAVINSAITAALAGKQDKGDYAKATDLAAVAKTGNYNDLTGKPAVSTRMTVNTVETATELNLQLALNNIYELAGADCETMTFTLPSVAPALEDRDREIVIRFSVGSVLPTLTFSSALPLKLADGDSLTFKAGTDYEVSIIYTASGWNIVCQSFAGLTEG